MKFFSPTSELKELLLLQHIEENPETTQKQISKVISGAVSMVNLYIERLEEKKYLLRDYKTSKTVHYKITKEGIKRKKYLEITYLNELLNLYRRAEENVEKFLGELEDRGYKKILLYGGGEVAEIMLKVIADKNKNLSIVGVIDDYSDKDQLLGNKLYKREYINTIEHDGIVITSYTYEGEIEGKLREISYPKKNIEKFFTK